MCPWAANRNGDSLRFKRTRKEQLSYVGVQGEIPFMVVLVWTEIYFVFSMNFHSHWAPWDKPGNEPNFCFYCSRTHAHSMVMVPTCFSCHSPPPPTYTRTSCLRGSYSENKKGKNIFRMQCRQFCRHVNMFTTHRRKWLIWWESISGCSQRNMLQKLH